MKFTVAYFTEGGRLGKSPDMVNPLLSLPLVYLRGEGGGGGGGGALLIPNESRNKYSRFHASQN